MKSVDDSRYRGKKVLVTGGAGFIGSRLVASLVKLNAKVTVLDDLFTGSKSNLDGLKKIDFIEDSVANAAVVRKVVKNKDLVFHLAARNIIVSTSNPRMDYDVNIGGTLNVLLAAAEQEKVRVVYSSSASVYGNPTYLPICEDARLVTLSPYSVSKLAGENYCIAFFETYGVDTCVLRFSNVFGIGQNPANPYCGVVAKFFESALNGIAIQIHGDGEQTRDFTFVADVVNVCLLAGLSSAASGEVFNVGTGIETSINRLAETIIKVTGGDVESRHIDRRDIDNIRRRVLNIEKTRMKLRWVPEYTVRTGLEETAAWYRTSL